MRISRVGFAGAGTFCPAQVVPDTGVVLEAVAAIVPTLVMTGLFIAIAITAIRATDGANRRERGKAGEEAVHPSRPADEQRDSTQPAAPPPDDPS